MAELTQQQARSIVEALTKETGLPVADLLRLATGEADRLADQLTDEASAQPIAPGKDPTAALLWDKAHAAGFAGVFADIRANEQKAEGEAGILDWQAWFCGWWHIYNRPNGKEILKRAGLPVTFTELAPWLNRSRAALYKTMALVWFKKTGVQSWMDAQIMGMIPAALARLEQNITDGNGAVSNQAIKLALDEARALGGRATRDGGAGDEDKPFVMKVVYGERTNNSPSQPPPEASEDN